MKKTISVALGSVAAVMAVGVVAAAAGPILYRDIIADTAITLPTVIPTMIEEPDASLANVDPLSGVWNISEGSYAGYRVNEVLNDGTKTPVTGRINQVRGTVTLTEETLTAANVTVEVATIATGNSLLDAYFRDTAMRVDNYPTAAFTITSPVALFPAPVAGEVQTRQATGDLTLHGITKTLQIKLQAQASKTGVEITGSIPVSFSDYGVTAPDLGFVSVQDSGTIEFFLVVTKQ